MKPAPHISTVTPAQAGAYPSRWRSLTFELGWIPAFAGMTVVGAEWVCPTLDRHPRAGGGLSKPVAVADLRAWMDPRPRRG